MKLFKNKRTYFTIGACIGAVATAIVTARKAPVIKEKWREMNLDDDITLAEKCLKVAPDVLPIAAATMGTLGCIVGSYAEGSKEITTLSSTAAGYLSAYTHERKVLEKVDEKLKETNEHKDIVKESEKEVIREAAQTEVNEKDVIHTGRGNVLFFAPHVERYFRDSPVFVMNALRKFENEVNSCDYGFDGGVPLGRIFDADMLDIPQFKASWTNICICGDPHEPTTIEFMPGNIREGSLESATTWEIYPGPRFISDHTGAYSGSIW